VGYLLEFNVELHCHIHLSGGSFCSESSVLAFDEDGHFDVGWVKEEVVEDVVLETGLQEDHLVSLNS